jgi:hypothetical protein
MIPRKCASTEQWQFLLIYTKKAVSTLSRYCFSNDTRGQTRTGTPYGTAF